MKDSCIITVHVHLVSFGFFLFHLHVCLYLFLLPFSSDNRVRIFHFTVLIITFRVTTLSTRAALSSISLSCAKVIDGREMICGWFCSMRPDNL